MTALARARVVVSLVALLALAGSGCAAWRPASERRPSAKTAELTPPVAPSPTPREAPRPASTVPTTSMLVSPLAEEPRGGGELISFSVKNVDIKDVLLGLSRLSRTNIIFDQDLAGKVSLDLREVTLEEALESLAPPLGIEWTSSGRTIYVTKQKMQIRIFPLNYVTTRRTGESQVSATSSGGSVAASGGAAAPSTGGAQAGGEQGAGFSRVKGEDSTNLWDEVKTTLEKLLSPQGKYSLNPMAAIAVVTDFPPQLQRIAEYLGAVEKSVRRQVLIQAEILEIKLTDEFEYGIDISWLRDAGTFKGSKPGLFPRADSNRPTSATLADAGPKRTLISQLLNPGTGIFSVGLIDVNLSVVLDLLQSEGRLRTLSRPSVSTLNNQKAIIKVATNDVFFRARVKAATTTTAEAVEFEPQPISIGIVLSVTPQISDDGYVIMDVAPSVTEQVATRTSPKGDQAPVVDERATNTVLRVKDGESIVIAGLVKTKADKQVKRVPFLSDIPALGVLFKQIDEVNQNTELLIKITPRVVQTTP